MKYIKLGMVICVILALFPVALEAQNTMKNDINAIVRGSQGEPLKGAVISTDKDSVLTVTDASGAFSVNVPGGSALQISASGFITKVVSANSDLKDIALDAENKLVQVAYRKVDKKDLLGGVSVVNESEIIGKNYTTYSLDNMDALASGFNGNIWGNSSYLVLVDVVPRDANNVSPTEIDQITFLKGVSAVALYGSRGAKGVVYITTKRGTASAQRIDVRANTGMYIPKAYPQYLGSAEYMTLYNEALQNDGIAKRYLDEDIYKSASGINPYKYPNVNYYSSDYLKKFTVVRMLPPKFQVETEWLVIIPISVIRLQVLF
jgi:TonB-dependent SusC/RagA subfamily outer membrane receptor